MLLSQLKEGDALLDFVGLLGKATDFEGAKKVCVTGGGVGNAIAYPLQSSYSTRVLMLMLSQASETRI